MAITTLTFRVSGMHCGSCGLLVDDVLEDLPGVHGSRTSAKAGTSVVELDSAHLSPTEVVKAIAEAGYRAELAT